MHDKKEEDYNPLNWVDEYGNYLYNFAYFRVKNKVVAEDLVQETFLSALKNLKKFSKKSSLKTWLTAILKNKIKDHFKKYINNITTEDDNELYCETEVVYYQEGRWKDFWDVTKDPVIWNDSPYSNLKKREFWNVFNKCVSELPQKFQAIYTLREVEEISTEKICQDYGISSSNIWVILHRSRKQIRRCLEINWYGGKLYPRKNK